MANPATGLIALASPIAQRAPQITPARHNLQIFDQIERGFGVVPIVDDKGAPLLCAGDVAVYDSDWLNQNELRPGIYCVEWQTPANLLTPEMFAERYAKGEYPRMRIDREVVAVAPAKRDPSHWYIHPLTSVYRGVLQMSDGPLESWQLASKLLGPVVGLYRPFPIGGSN